MKDGSVFLHMAPDFFIKYYRKLHCQQFSTKGFLLKMLRRKLLLFCVLPVQITSFLLKMNGSNSYLWLHISIRLMKKCFYIFVVFGSKMESTEAIPCFPWMSFWIPYLKFKNKQKMSCVGLVQCSPKHDEKFQIYFRLL